MKHGKMRRLATGLLCLALAFALGGAALADVIWEPEDDFYAAHSEQCQYINRAFYSNGKSGYMEFFKKPGGKSLGFADNGGIFHIQFTYVDDRGNTWGICEYSDNGEKLIPNTGDSYKNGWVKMEEAIAVYDFVSFANDHGGEINAYDKPYEGLEQHKNIILWTYPNSGEQAGAIEQIDEGFSVASTYTDENDRLWGFVNYYQGNRSFWICLSAPENDSLPALEEHKPQLYKPQNETPPDSSGSDMTGVLIFAVSVAVVISLTLVFTLKNKKKKDE